MFDLVYADPPWSFKTYSDKGKGKSPDNHYPVLDIEEIKKLNIGSIVNKDSVLLLWATPSMLMYAVELFARRETPGWVCVGNEITGRDIRDDLKLLALDK